MQRTLRYITIFLTIIFFGYASFWYYIMNEVTAKLNKDHAGKEIVLTKDDTQEKYFIKFSKAISAGFPFKFAVQILDWEEEGPSSILNCKLPVEFGYDLVNQKLYAHYEGELIAKYKPLNSGFGSRIVARSYTSSLYLPISLQVLGILKDEEKHFELINFIKKFDFTSGKMEIFDLIDGQKTYEQEFGSIDVTFDKRKYYTSVRDFIENVPAEWFITYAAKINESSYIKKSAPASIIMGFPWPFTFNGMLDVKLISQEKSLEKMFSDIELDVKYTNDSKITNSNSQIYYKGKISPKNTNVTLKTNANIEIKEGFFNAALDFLKLLISNRNFATYGPQTIQELQYIINNVNKFNFNEFEQRKYNLDIDFLFLENEKTERIQLNKFALNSGKTGIHLVNDSKFSNMFEWNAKGKVQINNYPKLISLLGHNFYSAGENKFLSIAARELYISVAADFIKTISDQPESGSFNSSFEYDLDSRNINGGKIGNVTVGNIAKLYSLALLKKSAEKSEPNDQTLDKLKELIPKIKDYPGQINQFRGTPIAPESNLLNRTQNN